MTCLHEADRKEVLTRLREEGLKDLLLEVWLEDFPLDAYAFLFRLDKGNYMLNIPSIATIISYPDGKQLAGDEKLYLMDNAAPTIMGPRGIVHEIASMFPDRNTRNTNLMGMVLEKGYRGAGQASVLKSRKQFSDLLHLYRSVPEFDDTFSETTEDEFIDTRMDNLGKGRITTGVYRNGLLVSSATFTVYQIENVCTLPEYREQGAARACIEKLLASIPTQDGPKRLILFTGNPIAMQLYRKLGFTWLGDYARSN